MDGMFFLGGIFFVLSLVVPLLVLLGLLIILAMRRDDDADGTRGPAIYASMVAVVSVFTLLFAVTGLVGSLLDLTKDDDSSFDSFESEDDFGGDFQPDFGSDFGGRDPDDEAASNAVLSVIVGAVAAGVLALHRPLLERVRAGNGAAARVWRAYGLTVALLSLLIGIGAVAGLAYSIFGILAPGVSGAGSRGDAARTAAVLLVLAGGSAALFRWHANETGVLPKPAPPPQPPIATDVP